MGEVAREQTAGSLLAQLPARPQQEFDHWPYLGVTPPHYLLRWTSLKGRKGRSPVQCPLGASGAGLPCHPTACPHTTVGKGRLLETLAMTATASGPSSSCVGPVLRLWWPHLPLSLCGPSKSRRDLSLVQWKECSGGGTGCSSRERKAWSPRELGHAWIQSFQVPWQQGLGESPEL